MRRAMAAAGACLGLAIGSPALAAVPAGAPQERAGEFASAEDLLSALETADAGLRRLSAKLEYIKVSALGGDMQVRRGRLYFASDPSPPGPDRRRFAVEFSDLSIGREKRDDPQSYAFDGRWLLEKRPKEREFHLRQVVGPGEAFDPLRLGEGPFPLPLGQKKDEILSRYEAVLVPTADGLAAAEDATEEEAKTARALMDFAKGAWQVRLTPRDGDADEGYAEVRLWYRRDKDGRLLPAMARTVDATGDAEVAGDVSIVRLIDVKVNDKAGMKDGVFSVEAPEGWNGVVEEYRGQAR